MDIIFLCVKTQEYKEVKKGYYLDLECKEVDASTYSLPNPYEMPDDFDDDSNPGIYLESCGKRRFAKSDENIEWDSGDTGYWPDPI